MNACTYALTLFLLYTYTHIDLPCLHMHIMYMCTHIPSLSTSSLYRHLHNPLYTFPLSSLHINLPSLSHYTHIFVFYIIIQHTHLPPIKTSSFSSTHMYTHTHTFIYTFPQYTNFPPLSRYMHLSHNIQHTHVPPLQTGIFLLFYTHTCTFIYTFPPSSSIDTHTNLPPLSRYTHIFNFYTHLPPIQTSSFFSAHTHTHTHTHTLSFVVITHCKHQNTKHCHTQHLDTHVILAS